MLWIRLEPNVGGGTLLGFLSAKNGALGFGIIAGSLLATGSLITRFSVGPLAISAYLTIVVTGFLVVALSSQIALRRFQSPSWQRLFRSRFFWWPLAPLCVFLLWSIFSLIFSVSIPGLQNVMTMAVFIFGIVFVALNFPGNSILLFWNIMAYATLAHSLFALASNLCDWQIVDNRAFAMTAVVGLAAMVPMRPPNIILRLAPYVVFISILFSASRTSTFAALCIVGLVVLREEKPVKLAAFKGAIIYLGALAVTVITYVFYAPANARLEAGDQGVVLPNLGSPSFTNSSGATNPVTSTGPAFVVNTNGRIDAWTELLSTVKSPVDWLFGQGSGASALYAREHMSAFTQSLNEYLRIYIDTGGVGLLLFLSGIGFLIFGLWRDGGFRASLNQAGLLVIFVTLVASATDGQLIYPFTVIPVAFVIGLALKKVARDGLGASSISVREPRKYPAIQDQF
jgi:hypothetical protein